MVILPSVACPNKTHSEQYINLLKIKRSTCALLKRVQKEDCPICLNDFDVNEKVCCPIRLTCFTKIISEDGFMQRIRVLFVLANFTRNMILRLCNWVRFKP